MYIYELMMISWIQQLQTDRQTNRPVSAHVFGVAMRANVTTE